ncbi:MAG: O-antigen ligase family protein [Luteolibacter sp.]
MNHKSTLGGDACSRRASVVFGGFWFLMFIATFFVAGPWAGFHGCLFLAVGLLMGLCPPEVALPRVWKVFAILFMVAGLAEFLPAAWFGVPEWRRHLEALGVPTGSMVVIQARQAAETWVIFGITLYVGLWLAGHRASSAQLRIWALAFTIGVAIYAVISRVLQDAHWSPSSVEDGVFGFFPNRNHTGTYLAMGAVCGLGNIMQAIRDRHYPRLASAVVASLICLWAVVGWSVSRGGVLLLAIGALIWIFMLGRHYLGTHGRRALALLALAIIGGFLIADTSVKGRIFATVEKAGNVVSASDPSLPTEGKSSSDRAQDLDLRIPIALDTFALIRDFKWTGIGAAQFFYIFPQYGNLTAVANDSDTLHPESDWLWMASELGIPATLALAALVVSAFGKCLPGILKGRDRAIRASCFVAAMLVPLHGVFDVPGHRITLAWSAVFLFCLALHPPHGEAVLRPTSVWSSRVAAILLLAASVFLIRAQWLGGAQPSVVVAREALLEARQLYREYQDLQHAASVGGKEPERLAASVVPIEKALVLLEKAVNISPLDRKIRRYQGFLALHFDDRDALVRETFKIERDLDPKWVNAPLDQALAWSNADGDETANLWDVALQRARWLDQYHPGSRWSEATIRMRIREQARGKPLLEQILKERFGE